jgi:hypothetical protein
MLLYSGKDIGMSKLLIIILTFQTKKFDDLLSQDVRQNLNFLYDGTFQQEIYQVPVRSCTFRHRYLKTSDIVWVSVADPNSFQIQIFHVQPIFLFWVEDYYSIWIETILIGTGMYNFSVTCLCFLLVENNIYWNFKVLLEHLGNFSIIFPSPSDQKGGWYSLQEKEILYRYTVGVLLCTYRYPVGIVVDPWHFGMDPDPRFRTTGLRIRIKFFFLSFLLISFGRNISLQRLKAKIFFKKSRITGFSFLFLLVDWRIRTNNDRSGSGRPKKLRIRIHNTDCIYFLFITVLWLLT